MKSNLLSLTESVFGSSLTELATQDKTNIPIFVLQCINHIEKSEELLKTDGLYRISGNAAVIQKIRYEVSRNGIPILFQFTLQLLGEYMIDE